MPVAFLVRGQPQIGTEERAAIFGGVDHPQLLHDIGGDLARSGRGEGQHRQVAEAPLEPGQVAIGGAEVVAPLADAVRLVDGDQRELHVFERPADLRLQPFGRAVDQLVLAAADGLGARAPLLLRQRRVEERGAQPHLLHGVDLILHERDQRRDHQREAHQPRRNLIGERLAGAGRHHADAVAPGEDGVDDLLLPGAKRVVAEQALQHYARRAFRGGAPDGRGQRLERAQIRRREMVGVTAPQSAQLLEPRFYYAAQLTIAGIAGAPGGIERRHFVRDVGDLTQVK